MASHPSRGGLVPRVRLCDLLAVTNLDSGALELEVCGVAGD